MSRPDILSGNTKLDLSEELGLALIRGFQGLPGLAAGRGEACPDRGACYKGCLAWTGYGAFRNVRDARRERHRYLIGPDGRPTAHGLAALREDLERLERDADRRGLEAGARLNVLTDYPWEQFTPELFRQFPRVAWYDYTKSRERFERYLRGEFPPNYVLAFSVSERTPLAEAWGYFKSDTRPVRLAVVCDEAVRMGLLGRRLRVGVKSRHLASIVDGDAHDAIWLRPRRCILALSAKAAGGSRAVEGEFAEAGTADLARLAAGVRP